MSVAHPARESDSPVHIPAGREYDLAAQALLSECVPAGHWVGELSTSALSTATAVMALDLVRRERSELVDQLSRLVQNGLRWLADNQNADGGWGDTCLLYTSDAADE